MSGRSLTDVANLALFEIGLAPLGDYLTDTTDIADAIRLLLPVVYDNLVMASEPQFVIKIAALALVSSIPDANGFYSFQPPSDWERTLEPINTKARSTLTEIRLTDTATYTYDPSNLYYGQQDGLIISNTDKLQIRYISNSFLNFPNKWPSAFLEAIVKHLAEKLASRYAPDAGLRQSLANMALAADKNLSINEQRQSNMQSIFITDWRGNERYF